MKQRTGVRSLSAVLLVVIVILMVWRLPASAASSDRYLILLSGLGSDSGSRFCTWYDLRAVVFSADLYAPDHVVYFSYRGVGQAYTAEDTYKHLDLTVEVLKQHVDQILQGNPNAKIDIAGHSLGGLVTFSFVRQYGLTAGYRGKILHAAPLDGPVNGLSLAMYLSQSPQSQQDIRNSWGGDFLSSDIWTDMSDLAETPAATIVGNRIAAKSLADAGTMVKTFTNENDLGVSTVDASIENHEWSSSMGYSLITTCGSQAWIDPGTVFGHNQVLHRGVALWVIREFLLTDPTPGIPPSWTAEDTTDSAAFVSNVTYPDGSAVAHGQSFTKTWRVRNSGTSTWDGYRLVFASGDQLGGASSAAIPVTGPGQQVDNSVAMQAPTNTGDKAGYWKIVDRSGVEVQGGRVWVKVNVLASGGTHIASFTADPPSPSSASLVRLTARVNWWPQFRDMRVVADNQILGETSEINHTFDWNVSSGGSHTLVLEVADQTDTSWSHPERQVLAYTVPGAPAGVNHAPNQPDPLSPYDFYVYYSGNTATLCAQANGDPDAGDTVTGYYFDIFGSAELWNSGWVGSNCATTSGLGPHNYQWRVKVRDSHTTESDWSDVRHFTLVNQSLSISELYFQAQDGNSEVVKIRACTSGQAGIGITLRVSVNDANDGSGNGQWHIVKEQGSPCFNDIDAPVWYTLDYGDGSHRVRVEAHGLNSGWDGAAVREETYTLPHRRPGNPTLLAPLAPSGQIRDPLFFNTRTITFRWQPGLRSTSLTLHVGTNPSPSADASPLLRQTFDGTVAESTVTLAEDYPTLYWQVTATNDRGTTGTSDPLFGIDRVAPACVIQALAPTTPESVFQVNWSGRDNLAGVSTYDVQYRDSARDSWNDWLVDLPATRAYELFTGQPGHAYAFRCRSIDAASNTSPYPAQPDTTIMIDPTTRPSAPWWNQAYAHKRNIVVLNNMSGAVLPAGYPVHLRFDNNTTPSAASLYEASQSAPKCNDLRVVDDNFSEISRVVESCSINLIDLWFRVGAAVAASGNNGTSHQLYYGNASPGVPLANSNDVFYPEADANTVGLWNLDGNAIDSSTYANNGQWGGGGIWAPGKFGEGLRMPGGSISSAGVVVPGTEAMRVWSFTIEAWVKRSCPDGYCDGAVTSQGTVSNSQMRWFLRVDYDKPFMEVWNSGQRRGPNGSYPKDGNWHHLAMTWDNNSKLVTFYVDGGQVDQAQLGGNGLVSGDPTIYIGSQFPGDGLFSTFSGTVDGVRLSNLVRTSFPYAAFAAITNEPTATVADIIDPPMFGSPDLAVLSLTAYPNSSGGVLAQAIVQNQSDVPTQNGFWTDLYADHLPTGAGDYTGSIRYWVASPITAQQIVTLTTVITGLAGLSGASLGSPSLSAETSAMLYIQVDSTGAVNETSKANNISTGFPVCLAGPDGLEPDGNVAAARMGTVDAGVQRRNHDVPGDQDWITFAAQAGMTYAVETTNLDTAADTYLYLYATDGTTLLAANDDYSGTLSSRIEWVAPSAGTYFVAVKHWNPNAGGCGTGYDLAVSTLSETPTTPTATVTPTGTPTAISTPTATETPGGAVTATPTPTATPTAGYLPGTPTVVATIAVGANPVAVAVNSATNRIYVSNYDSGSVTVVDGLSNAVIATIPVGSNPFGITANPATNRIYVGNRGSGTVSVIDGITNSVIGSIAVGSGPVCIAIDPVTNRIYVANNGSSNISVIDGATDTVTTTITLTGQPGDIAVNPLTQRLYAGDHGGNRVMVVDLSTSSLMTSISVSGSPTGVGVNPTTNRIYAALWNNERVAVIDGATNSVLSDVWVGSCPVGIGVNAQRNRVYAGIWGFGYTTIIDGATSSVLMNVPTGNTWALALNAQTNRIYVTGQTANILTVIADDPFQEETPTATSTPSATSTSTATATRTPTATLIGTPTFTPTPVVSYAAWPMFGRDARHTGRSLVNGPQIADLAWNLAINAFIDAAPVVGPSGRVYVTTHAGTVFAINPTDGTIAWNGGGGEFIAVGPEEEVYASISSGSVMRISNGSVAWLTHFPGPYGNVAAPTYDGQTVYVGFPYDRSVYALNAADGAIRWSTRMGDIGRQFSSAAVADGKVYIGAALATGVGYLHALDQATGALLWSYETGGGISMQSAVVVGSDGTVYFAAYDGYLYAVNGADGVLRWRYQAGAAMDGAPALGADGTIYLGARNGVHALNASDGSLRWQYPMGDGTGGSPCVGADSTVYISGYDGHLYALDGADGAMKWRYAIGAGSGIAAPAIGGDGTIYVTGGGLVYAFRAASAPTATPTATATATPTTAPMPTVSIPLQVGWNLISLPLAPLHTAVTEILAAIAGSYDLVYNYDASDTTDPWKKYDIAQPPFLNDLTVITESMGLWLHATSPASLTVTGTIPISPSVSLLPGWNLVGCASLTPRPITESLSTCSGTYDLAYTYVASDTLDPWKKFDTAQPPFLNDLVTCDPGRGYWIHVTQPCELILP